MSVKKIMKKKKYKKKQLFKCSVVIDSIPFIICHDGRWSEVTLNLHVSPGKAKILSEFQEVVSNREVVEVIVRKIK